LAPRTDYVGMYPSLPHWPFAAVHRRKPAAFSLCTQDRVDQQV